MHYVWLIVVMSLTFSGGFVFGLLWRSSIANREIESAYAKGAKRGYAQGIAEICPD